MFYYTQGDSTFCYKNVPCIDVQLFKSEMSGCGVQVAVVSIDKFLFVDMEPHQRSELEDRGWTFVPSIYEGRLVFIPKKPFLSEHRLEPEIMRRILANVMLSEFSLDFACEERRWDVTVHTYHQACMIERIEQYFRSFGERGNFKVARLSMYGNNKFHTHLKGIGRVKVPFQKGMQQHSYWWITPLQGKAVVAVEPFNQNEVIDTLWSFWKQ